MRRRPGFTRADRLGALMRDEVDRILTYEVSAAVVQHVQVTETRLAKDLGHLRVRYVMKGSDEASEPARLALDRAAGYVARVLTDSLQLQRPPRVVFSFDEEYARLRKLQALLGHAPPTSAGEVAPLAGVDPLEVEQLDDDDDDGWADDDDDGNDDDDDDDDDDDTDDDEVRVGAT